MAATGYTPIQLYYSTTASATPSAGNLAAGELAINTNDGKLYYKDSGGTVQLIASQSGASGSVTSVAMTVPTFLSVSGSPITSSGTLAVTLSGTALPVVNGGTGQTSYTDGQLLIGNTTGNTLTKSTLTAGSGISITNGSGTITIAATGGTGTVTSVAMTVPSFLSVSGSPVTSSGTLAVSLSGTALPAANGGTGQVSYSTGDLLYASGSTAISKLAIGTTNYVLTSSGTAPQYVAQSTLAVGSATNLAGGAASQIPYQTGSGATSFISNGTSGQVLTSNGASAPTWQTAAGITTGKSIAMAMIFGF